MAQIKIEITYDPATERLPDVLDGLNMSAKYKAAVKVSCEEQTKLVSAATEAAETKAPETTEPSAPADTDETAAESTSADEETKKVTKTDVRAAATALSKANKRAELKAIFTKFGGTKLSDMKEEDYPALLKELVAANG